MASGYNINPYTGNIEFGAPCGGTGSCVLTTIKSDIIVGHAELTSGTYHPNFGNSNLPTPSRFLKILEDVTLTKVTAQLYGTSAVDVELNIKYVGGANIASLIVPVGSDMSIDTGVLAIDLLTGDKIQLEVVTGDSNVSALVTLDLESNSCKSASAPIVAFSEITFGTTAKTLANGQSDITDYNVAGVLLAKSTSVSLSSDMSSFNFVDVNGFVVANNKVRVITINQTGVSTTIPVLSMKVLQKN